MAFCSQCGTQFFESDKFCNGCGCGTISLYTQQAQPQQPQYSDPPPLAFPPPPPTAVYWPRQSLAPNTPHHVAARGLSQIFGVHPAVAFLTITIDLMMNVGTWATWGALWVATIPVGLVLGAITYLAQKKWYDDDDGSAIIKALIVALLTAIPAPLTPVLIPSGIVGIFNRKKN